MKIKIKSFMQKQDLLAQMKSNKIKISNFNCNKKARRVIINTKTTIISNKAIVNSNSKDMEISNNKVVNNNKCMLINSNKVLAINNKLMIKINNFISNHLLKI